MIEGSEELKMVLELATSKGRKEAENEMLETQKKQLEEANTKLLRQLSQKDKLLKEKEVAKRPVKQENIYGDKVGEKTVIPNVGNYRPDIQTQNMNVDLPHMGRDEQELLADE